MKHQLNICQIAIKNFGRQIGEEGIARKVVPSTKRASESPSRSRPAGTGSEEMERTSAMPEIPKKRYIVLCCQFISFTHSPL